MSFIRIALIWSTGLLFFLANQMLMTDFFYRPFFSLTNESWFLVFIGILVSFTFGLLLSVFGEIMYDILSKRFKTKQHTKKRHIVFTDRHVLLNLYGFSLSMLLIFGIKMILEFKLYNFSNIQYIVLFSIFIWSLHKQLSQDSEGNKL